MTRVKAALTHFGISVFVFALFLSLVFFIWYAWPFNITQGIAEIVYLMAGVDVVLGPLLTLIVFKAGKKGLKFDLSLIALVQVAALVYGAMVIYKERPAYIVFNVDRYSVVSVSEVDMSESPIPEQAIGIFEKPKFIYAVLAQGNEAMEIAMAAASGGNDIDRLPKYYRDYKGNVDKVVSGTRSASEIPVAVDAVPNVEQMNYAPVVGKRKTIIAILDKSSGEVVDYRLADPWAK